MVCMGNLCRSPTAEGVLRQRLERAGLADRVRVDSAGTHGYHAADPPDSRAQQSARRRGVEIGAQRARQVEAADFDTFQFILAMDDDNLANLERIRPENHSNRPQLLMEYARRPGAPRAVPDPYYGAPDGFERVLDLIEEACDGLVERLRQNVAEAAPRGTS
ncbi:MAG: low molecular weight protein-tyrosine-phosphatase [Rubrivivax sp.]